MLCLCECLPLQVCYIREQQTCVCSPQKLNHLLCSSSRYEKPAAAQEELGIVSQMSLFHTKVQAGGDKVTRTRRYEPALVHSYAPYACGGGVGAWSLFTVFHLAAFPNGR